jgi:hypothetical protein
VRRAALPMLGLVAVLTPFAALALVCWWLVVCAEMPGRTKVRRALFGTVCVYAMTAVVLTSLAVLHGPGNPRLMVAALLLTALVWRVRSPARERVPLTNASDRWGASLGIVTFVTLYLPFVGASTGRTMALLSQTTDGATHVQLVMAIIRHHGYVHLSHPAGLSPGADGYPSAWHGNLWVMSDLLLGRHPSAPAIARVVGLAAVMSYAVLCAVLVALALDLSPHGNELSARAALGGVVCLGLSTTIGFGVFFLQLASYTQIFAMLALLALVLAADEAAADGRRLLLVGVACSIALMQSWYLLAPLLLVALLLLVSRVHVARRLLLVSAVTSLPFVLYPALTGPSSTQVDLSGPLVLPTIAGVLGLLVATGVGCVAMLRRRTGHGGLVLVGVTVASLMTMVFLIAKQGFVEGSGVTYYGAKVLLTTLLLGTVLAAGAVASGLSSRDRTLRAAAAVAGIGVVLGTVSTAWAAIPPSVGLYEGHLDAATLDAIYRQHPQGATPGIETWVMDGCDRVGDLVATKWLYDTSLAWTDDLRYDLTAYADAQRGDVHMVLHRLENPRLHSLEVYLHRECDPTALHQLEGNLKVRVIRVP